MGTRVGVAYHPLVPRHLRIQRVLRARIESEEWEGDRPIPTEMELLAEFGVSRTTIREALGVLAREGLIVRHRGRGSFVHSRPGVDRPQAVTNLILGYKAEIKVITVQTVPAPAHIVGPLGIERGTPVTRLVRLEMIDAAPLAVVVNYMLPSLGKRIRPRDLTRISLLEFLRDRLGMRLGTIHQSLEARLPDIETTGLLGTDLPQPVLALRLVVTDVAGTPVEVSDALYRADRYRYEVKTQLPPARRQPTVRETRSRGCGTAPQHAIAVFNRLTGATLATHLSLVKPGDVVIGLSVSHSHPSVLRAASHVGARFTDTPGLEEFKRALDRDPKVALVGLTRLAVTYELLPVEAIRTIVRLAHDKGALVYVDDAGGARVGPASFDQPKTLELGVDVGATGLDKYGTLGPRFGLLGGRADLVASIRARAFECGLETRPMLYQSVVRTLEKYSPKRVQELIDTTKAVAAALRPIFGDRLRETPTTAQLLADDVLAIAMERGGVKQAPIVPFEASAALCMLLLQDHSMLTVDFVGMPPGGADILFKFIPPETLARFGGPRKFASAVDGALTTLGSMLKDPASIRALLLGGR